MDTFLAAHRAQATWQSEARAYLQYLAEQRAAQAQAQADLDAMFDAEAEKAWQRRAQVCVCNGCHSMSPSPLRV